MQYSILNDEDGESVFVSELYIDSQKTNLDLFFISEMLHVVVVSERLKDALEAARFKGMKFTPANGYKQMMFDYYTKSRLQ